jgi:hypothetical protein
MFECVSGCLSPRLFALDPPVSVAPPVEIIKEENLRIRTLPDLQALQLNFPSLDDEGVVAVGFVVYAEGHLFILRHQPALPYHSQPNSGPAMPKTHFDAPAPDSRPRAIWVKSRCFISPL